MRLRRTTIPRIPVGLEKLLKDCLPTDHARQVSATYYIEQLLSQRPGGVVVDLGCGAGESYDVFKQVDPGVRWIGLDIDSSPAVGRRSRTDIEFRTFDGVSIPFDDAAVDIVFSKQVFEHVRHPRQLLMEICRVLRPGGAFIGSVSFLEPYHALSYFNYTPLGWREIVVEAGMSMVELRPGIDGISLITRKFRGRSEETERWFGSSPLNEEIDAWAQSTRAGVAKTNARKLQYCGQICFHARRPI